MADLETKSLTELRGMYSAMGGNVSFSDSKTTLITKIGLRISDRMPKVEPIQTAVPSDQRLRTVAPARNMTQEQVAEALKPFTDAGLILSFPEHDSWQMTFGKKTDSGSLRVPLRVIVGCARSVMK
jgi:hypothetical protein